MQGGAWRCTHCARQCAKSADFCPGCGQHWTKAAEGYAAWAPRVQGRQGQPERPGQWPKSPRRKSPRARQQGGQSAKGGGNKGMQSVAKGTGKGAKAEAAKPSLDSLPAAPSGAAVSLPKGPPASSSSQGPSLEKTQLDALTGCLSALRESLPAEVRETLDRLQLATSANTTKDMHRAVAAQATAKKQLVQVQAARATYLDAWNSYIEQVSRLLKQQVEEQAAQLEAYDAAELQWSGALEQTTADLARLTRTSTMPRVEVEEMDLEQEDQMLDADIRTAKELEQRREQHLADSHQLANLLASIQQTASSQLKQAGRDGSRTPRRKSRETEPVDLTAQDEAEDNDKAADRTSVKPPATAPDAAKRADKAARPPPA